MIYLNLNWRGIFGICIFINGVIEIFYYFFTYESPRRLLKHQRFIDAIDTINAIAKFNGTFNEVDKEIRTIEFNDFKTFIDQKRNEKKKTIFILQNKAPLFKGIKALFYKSTRSDFLILSGIWFSSNCIYNSITSFIKIKYDRYPFYFSMLFFVECLSVVIIYYIVKIKKIGRKKTLIILFFTYSSTLLINYFFSFYFRVTEVLFGFISRLFFAGVNNILYFYTIEIYPTPVRYSGLGLNVSFSYLGNIVSMWFFVFHLQIGTAIYICIGLASAILMFLLKETNERDFEDVFEKNAINDEIVSSDVDSDL